MKKVLIVSILLLSPTFCLAADPIISSLPEIGTKSRAMFDCAPTESSKQISSNKVCMQSTTITKVEPKTCKITTKVTAAECKEFKKASCDPALCQASVGTESTTIDILCLLGG